MKSSLTERLWYFALRASSFSELAIDVFFVLYLLHLYLNFYSQMKSFANANVLLVLGELMGGDNDDGSVKRTAIPLIAGAIVLAQFTMTVATFAGDSMTKSGWGRKPLFMAGLLTLPVRCALIIFWKDAGEAFLLSTQILDGLGGGFFGLLHPYLVADITFGTGRFNVLSECCVFHTFIMFHQVITNPFAATCNSGSDGIMLWYGWNSIKSIRANGG